MNRSMVTGILVGASIAVAGAVMAGYVMRDDTVDADALQVTASDRSIDAAEPAAPEQVAAAEPAAPAEECWNETVTHTKDPKDDKKIAGTVIGAVVGGVIGNQFGGGSGKTLATAAGAAAGGYGGNRAQKEFQENQTYTTVERRCRPVE